MLNYKASPTGQLFLDSRAFTKVLMGPVGGGKSTVALMDLVQRAVNQEPFNGVRRTKMGVLRNTMAQLKATVRPLIDQWMVTLPGTALGQWRLTDNVFEAKFRMPDNTVVHSEFMLLAADTPDDVRRLLSLELSAAWVEEAREVDPEVFNGLQGRVNRFPNRLAGGVTYPGVIASTNPPPIGGFWHMMLTSELKGVAAFRQPAALLDDGSINPEAENLEHLASDYYENLIAGRSTEWIDVYLKNHFGQGDAGRPVYRASFKKSFHVSKTPLIAVPQSVNPLVIGMDNGLQAAATIGQRDMRGRVNILAECYVPKEETMGVESFLDRLLIPLLTAKFHAFTPKNIVFVLDPACFQRSQVDEKTIAMAVTARGYSAIKASTNDPERRVAAVEGLLTLAVDGQAGLLIDPSCTHLIDAMEWGYRYKKTVSDIVTPTFEKNHWSHCFTGDTLVSTTRGDVRIDEITCVDQVLTPGGHQPVVATMSHRTTALVRLEFDDGTRITCTGDHPFYTQRGMVQANMLEYTDLVPKLDTTCPKQSTPSRNSTESVSTSNLRATTKPATEHTGARSTCTATSGNTSMGRFQRVTRFTTSTATKLTTALKTLSCFPQLNILGTTWPSAWQTLKPRKESDTPLDRPSRQQNTGCDPQRSLQQPLSAPRDSGKKQNRSSCSAATAESRSSATSTPPSAVFAHQAARGVPASSLVSTTKPESAPCVEPPSMSTGTALKSHAARLVRRSQWSANETPVYDLTVANEHCFYANGLLVSNCAEAAQYLALHYNITSGFGHGTSRGPRAVPRTKSKYVYS